jgi:hypothetical protein
VRVLLLPSPTSHLCDRILRPRPGVKRKKKRKKKERFRITAGGFLDYTDRKIRGGEKSSTSSRM